MTTTSIYKSAVPYPVNHALAWTTWRFPSTSSGRGGDAQIVVFPAHSCENAVRVELSEISLPIKFELSDLGALPYELVRPIPVEMDREENYYLVYDEMGFAYGTGASPREAIEDYKMALVGTLEALLEDEPLLAPPLAERLRALAQHLSRRG